MRNSLRHTQCWNSLRTSNCRKTSTSRQPSGGTLESFLTKEYTTVKARQTRLTACKDNQIGHMTLQLSNSPMMRLRDTTEDEDRLHLLHHKSQTMDKFQLPPRIRLISGSPHVSARSSQGVYSIPSQGRSPHWSVTFPCFPRASGITWRP
jgi:hypothetical protein